MVCINEEGQFGRNMS